MSAPKYNKEFQHRFGDVLKDARLKQKEFCELGGFGQTTVRLWKSGGGPLREHQKDRIIGVFNEKLKANGRPPITVTWLFEKWRSRSSSLNQTGSEVLVFPQVQIKRNKVDLRGVDLPDLLAPSCASVRIHQLYAPYIGQKLAKKLHEHSKNAIVAVENGDFEGQTRVGLQIAGDTQEFPSICGTGLYLAGEGLRLSADLESNPSKKANFYQHASAKYQEASELFPLDPRPVRGSARIKECEGLLDVATQGFYRAEGLVLTSKFQPEIDFRKPFLDHEHLRVVRHKIHCLFDLREQGRANAWNHEHKQRELEGFVVHCDNLHNELMASFHGRERWSQIEWFMGLVFLAKAWGHLKQNDRMLWRLLHALKIRRGMFIESDKLTGIEHANLEWWIGVAISFNDLMPKHLVRSIDRFHSALQEKDYRTVLISIDDLVREISRPGEIPFTVNHQTKL